MPAMRQSERPRTRLRIQASGALHFPRSRTARICRHQASDTASDRQGTASDRQGMKILLLKKPKRDSKQHTQESNTRPTRRLTTPPTTKKQRMTQTFLPSGAEQSASGTESQRNGRKKNERWTRSGRCLAELLAAGSSDDERRQSFQTSRASV